MSHVYHIILYFLDFLNLIFFLFYNSLIKIYCKLKLSFFFLLLQNYTLIPLRNYSVTWATDQFLYLIQSLVVKKIIEKIYIRLKDKCDPSTNKLISFKKDDIFPCSFISLPLILFNFHNILLTHY